MYPKISRIAGTVLQHGRAEADAGTRRMDDVRRRAEREPQHDDADDRPARAHQERGLVAAPRERGRREQERERISGRRAGDQPADRGTAPLGRVAVRDQHDRRRVGSALREGHERVQHEAGRVGAGPEAERDRGDRAEPRRPDENAARADAVGHRRKRDERDRVAELKAGRDGSGGGRRHPPLSPQHRDDGCVGHEHRRHAGPRNADGEQPAVEPHGA